MRLDSEFRAHLGLNLPDPERTGEVGAVITFLEQSMVKSVIERLMMN